MYHYSTARRVSSTECWIYSSSDVYHRNSSRNIYIWVINSDSTFGDASSTHLTYKTNPHIELNTRFSDVMNTHHKKRSLLYISHMLETHYRKIQCKIYSFCQLRISFVRSWQNVSLLVASPAAHTYHKNRTRLHISGVLEHTTGKYNVKCMVSVSFESISTDLGNVSLFGLICCTYLPYLKHTMGKYYVTCMASASF